MITRKKLEQLVINGLKEQQRTKKRMETLEVEYRATSLLNAARYFLGLYRKLTGTVPIISVLADDSTILESWDPDSIVPEESLRYKVKFAPRLPSLNRVDNLIRRFDEFISTHCTLGQGYQIHGSELLTAFRAYVREDISSTQLFPRITAPFLRKIWVLPTGRHQITKAQSPTGVIYYGITLLRTSTTSLPPESSVSPPTPPESVELVPLSSESSVPLSPEISEPVSVPQQANLNPFSSSISSPVTLHPQQPNFNPKPSSSVSSYIPASFQSMAASTSSYQMASTPASSPIQIPLQLLNASPVPIVASVPGVSIPTGQVNSLPFSSFNQARSTARQPAKPISLPMENPLK